MIDLISPPQRTVDTQLPIVHDSQGNETRIDLHVHSHASGYASNWWVRGLGLGFETRESYTAPEDVWTRARDAGMDFVTLTDHETLDGGRDLQRRFEFMPGVEVNARFPDDNSSVDILIYGLNDDDHREIQSRRSDVYALLDYLHEANLVHVLAHPLFDLGHHLRRAHVEKRMVLFNLWEWINGARPESQNRLAARIASSADAETLRQLASIHGLRKPDHRRIRGTGGSDDHGGLHIGRAWTRFPRLTGTPDLLEAMRAGETFPGGESGSVELMAHTAFTIAARAVEEHPESVIDREPFSTVRELLPLVPAFSSAQVRQLLATRYETSLTRSFPAGERGLQVMQTLASIGRLVEGHLLIAPYVGIHGYFGRERRKTEELEKEFGPRSGPLRIGIVVDDLDEIHGVATMYRNLERVAASNHAIQISLIRCQTDASRDPRLPYLRSVATLPLPLYPGRSLAVPSVLDVLDHLEAAAYDVVHIATPGPLGIATLFAATTLGIPVIGAYHTEYAAYARTLSKDHLLGDLVEGLIREFYRRCSIVAASSRNVAEALRARGFGDHIAVLRNGVDSKLFSPDHRDHEVHFQLGQGRKLLLYVGRVSREKDLDWLAGGYQRLRSRRSDIHLVIVGDGPYRAELENALDGMATFTGFLQGKDLARVMASCDLFVFPSTTDTLGRAILEAQACGLPAVVRDSGGVAECLDSGTTGLVIPAEDEQGYWSSVEALVDDDPLRHSMGVAARAFAAARTWDDVLEGFLALCEDVSGRGGTVNRVPTVSEIAVPV